MKREIKYPNLSGKRALLVESLTLSLLLSEHLIALGDMAVTMIPQEMMPVHFIINGIATFLAREQYDIAAIHIPMASSLDEANDRIRQVELLSSHNTVILAGVPSSMAAEQMYLGFSKLGFPLVMKSDANSLLKVFSSMMM